MSVHLAPESAMAAIRRSGIKPSPTRDGIPPSVFAMAVTGDFSIVRQWLRELKAGGARTIVAVDFRVPDDEPVWIGHYREVDTQVTASEAIGIVMHADDAEGVEVLTPRKVTAKKVHRIKHVPQVVGWRYSPGSHGRKPCGCPFCQQYGRPGSAKLRERYESELQGDCRTAQARPIARSRTRTSIPPSVRSITYVDG